jgi:hypothetical protein
MVTRVFNLVFASWWSVILLLVVVTTPEARDAFYAGVLLITLCWLSSAIGLLFRKRLAWWGSMIGMTLMFAASVTMIGVGVTLMPISHDPTDGIGFVVIMGLVGTVCSTPVLVGLFRLRRGWLHSEETMPNKSRQPTAAPLDF